VNSVSELTELEIDCIEYVSGYVANRFATEYPWLGLKEVEGSSWIQHVSRGNLTTPSPILFNCALTLEKLFNNFHGKCSLNKQPKVMTRLSNSLMNEIKKEKLDIPFKVVHCLVRTRTFIRLNYLNKLICSSATVKKNENSRKLKKFV